MSFCSETLQGNTGRACPHIHRLVAWTATVAVLLLSCGCARLHQPPQTTQLPVFAVLADIQYGDKDTEGARHFRTALLKLEECVADLAQRDLAFVILLGDIVEGHEKDQAKSAADLDAVLRVLDRQKAPVYHVLGNHCLRVGKETLRQRYGVQRFYYDFALLEALDRAGCVVAWFAGHDHAGGYAVRKGVHHVTIKGMVEAPGDNPYALIELYPAHLRESGVGAECSRRNMKCPAGHGR